MATIDDHTYAKTWDNQLRAHVWVRKVIWIIKPLHTCEVTPTSRYYCQPDLLADSDAK